MNEKLLLTPQTKEEVMEDLLFQRFWIRESIRREKVDPFVEDIFENIKFTPSASQELNRHRHRRQNNGNRRKDVAPL